VQPKAKPSRKNTVRRHEDKQPTNKAEGVGTDGSSTIELRKEQKRPPTAKQADVVPPFKGKGRSKDERQSVDWTKRHVWARAVVMREDVEREQMMRRRAEMGWD
jgi:hypothetical protein